jgi:hypothetical protein
MKRLRYILQGLYLVLAISPASAGKGAGRAPLPDGIWKNITPAGITMSAENHVFCQGMAIDPAHPSTLYLCVCAYDVSHGGLYKTRDGGSTWARIGNLDEPIHIVVDPHHSNHLYCVDGVRGSTQGFWVSTDGGNNWTSPPGFAAATQKPIGTQDLYSIAVDPTDFKHILVSFHSPWRGADGSGTNNCGVLESKDEGNTWLVHEPPAGSAGGYGMAVFFLYDPLTGQGDKNTWLFTTQAGGFYRTTDAGATWSQVYRLQMTHGGDQLYRTTAGVLYAGAYQYPVRSVDNGVSWQPLTRGLVYSWYMGICGDGKTLYTACSNTNEPFFTSPENDGLTWTAYRGGAQKFSAEPFEMRYDSTNHILYAASWSEGLLALKVK